VIVEDLDGTARLDEVEMLGRANPDGFVSETVNMSTLLYFFIAVGLTVSTAALRLS
jgi:hypothetical protein